MDDADLREACWRDTAATAAAAHRRRRLSCPPRPRRADTSHEATHFAMTRARHPQLRTNAAATPSSLAICGRRVRMRARACAWCGVPNLKWCSSSFVGHIGVSSRAQQRLDRLHVPRACRKVKRRPPVSVGCAQVTPLAQQQLRRLGMPSMRCPVQRRHARLVAAGHAASPRERCLQPVHSPKVRSRAHRG